MDDVRGLFLGMPHGTTPAAVTTNKNIIMSSFKSSGDIQKEEGGPDRNVGIPMGTNRAPLLLICFCSAMRGTS